MDPYEYLLSKLNVMLEFIPEFMSYSIYLKLETDKKLITNYIPIGWTHKQISEFLRNPGSIEFYRPYDKEIDQFCQQLNVFPNDLESIEHVDLLLTLHGMNKEA